MENERRILKFWKKLIFYSKKSFLFTYSTENLLFKALLISYQSTYMQINYVDSMRTKEYVRKIIFAKKTRTFWKRHKRSKHPFLNLSNTLAKRQRDKRYIKPFLLMVFPGLNGWHNCFIWQLIHLAIALLICVWRWICNFMKTWTFIFTSVTNGTLQRLSNVLLVCSKENSLYSTQ